MSLEQQQQQTKRWNKNCKTLLPSVFGHSRPHLLPGTAPPFLFLASSEPFFVPLFLAVGGCSFRTFNLVPGAGGIPSSRSSCETVGRFFRNRARPQLLFLFLLLLPLPLFNPYNALCRMVSKHTHIASAA